MNTIKNLIDTRKGESALIIGAGASIKENRNSINNFISENDPFIVGINNITEFWIPDYHLWTNTQRFRTYGQNIHRDSILLLGSNISLNVIKEVIGSRDYILINYTDKAGTSLDYSNGKIYGYYRTAGCLAIMIAHLMGAKDISVVGMDGYSLYKQEDIVSGKESHHCYGQGFTDTADWDTCVKKDFLISNILKRLKKYGINFSIITPTKYGDVYDSTRLHI